MSKSDAEWRRELAGKIVVAMVGSKHYAILGVHGMAAGAVLAADALIDKLDPTPPVAPVKTCGMCAYLIEGWCPVVKGYRQGTNPPACNDKWRAKDG